MERCKAVAGAISTARRKTSLVSCVKSAYLQGMLSLRKRSRMTWDVTIGLVLLFCGLLLAFRDRSPRPTFGSASVHGGSTHD